MSPEETLKFYQKHFGMFLSDFFRQGNRDFVLKIEPRSNVQSGYWFEAEWLTGDNQKRYIDFQGPAGANVPTLVLHFLIP